MNVKNFTSSIITTTATVSSTTAAQSPPPSLPQPAPPLSSLTIQEKSDVVHWIDDNDTSLRSNSIKDIYNDGYYMGSQSTPSSVVSSSCAASTVNEYSNQDSCFLMEEDDMETKRPRPVHRRSTSASDLQSFSKRRSRRKEPISEQRKINMALAKKLSPIARYKENLKKTKAKRNQRRKFSLLHSIVAPDSLMRKNMPMDSQYILKSNYFNHSPTSSTPLPQSPTQTASVIHLPEPSAFYPPQQMYIVDDTSNSLGQFQSESYPSQITPSTTLYSETQNPTISDPNTLCTLPLFLQN